jgi:DNA-binding transcriptional LysR family regulator
LARLTQWETHIGRRMRLRDLYVFFAVVDAGSMAQAASHLGVSTPSVSEVISGLEHVLGVRLLDRTPKGVVPTAYGHALLKRAHAAFDDLRLGIRDIEALADPQGGEVQIGCPESITAFLALVIDRLTTQNPRMRFSVQQVHWPAVDFPELRARKVDVVLGRLAAMPINGHVAEDIDAEILFDDPFSVVVGESSQWARSKNVGLADLNDEPWICTPLDVLAGKFLAEAFERQGLKAPTPKVATSSIQLRNILTSGGRYVAVLPRSVLKLSAERYGLRELSIKLSDKPSPVAVMTLRGRTLTPAVEAFMHCARALAREA